MSRTHNIYWERKLLGRVDDASFDHMNFYGRWAVLASADVYARFLASVDTDEGASVTIDAEGSALRGVVQLEPAAEIEIKLRR